jgi:DNA-binding MarR family transcriptional regulator
MSKISNQYQPEKTIQFPKEIRFNADLTFGERLYLAELKYMTREGKYPFSCKNLGTLFGVSHQTISTWTKNLVKMGFVDISMDYSNEECKQFLITK